MAEKSLKEVAAKMKQLDIAMLTTQTGKGQLTSRPMSNNGDVEYNGNSYYFTFEGARTVKDIDENAHVNLSFEGPKKLYISINGKAALIRDKAKMKEHWVKDLEVWFENGLDTPGVVMIHVKAERIKYWQGEDEGEVKI
ncbi:pyridoxamine 5'-phosphate oxidase family protein [Spirosoma flavum]|uniref:Pyridoxamine 5'-phosphate oxidase family protein n=1 Tax=Spirosoma flavum TaxID=2048557 RepID=A0ABW6AN02_9BACT